MPRPYRGSQARIRTGRRAGRTLIGTAVFSLVAATMLPAAGCYRRVVDARGLGADSTKLRSELEHEPAHYRTITETRRETREVRPARER